MKSLNHDNQTSSLYSNVRPSKQGTEFLHTRSEIIISVFLPRIISAVPEMKPAKVQTRPLYRALIL
jgi:hypothetical protein